MLVLTLLKSIKGFLQDVSRIQIDLYGSLSLTGRGHHTDRASILGLLGNKPDVINIIEANQLLAKSIEEKCLPLSGSHMVDFDVSRDIIFRNTNLPLHENGMLISAFDDKGNLLISETYYSVGGGFIVTADELKNGNKTKKVTLDFPFKSAEQLLNMAEESGLSLSALIQQNELAYRSKEALSAKTDQIWQVMSDLYAKGL